MHRKCVFLTSEARLIRVGTELCSIQTPNERNVTISSASLKSEIKSKHRLWTPMATGHFQTFVFFKYIKHSVRGLLLIMICGLLSINNRPQLVLEKQNTSQWCNVWKQKQCECVPPHNKDLLGFFLFSTPHRRASRRTVLSEGIFDNVTCVSRTRDSSLNSFKVHLNVTGRCLPVLPS